MADPFPIFTLRSPGGIVVTIGALGATLMRIDPPDRDGRFANILLGYGDPADYPAAGGSDPDVYLGATCGRYANRIAGARFAIDGERHLLAANEGANQLHGGARGFQRALWRLGEADDRHVVLHHHSPDGDQGYPGALDATASFTLADDGELTIEYTATTTRPTHVNLVSHGYFNLSGDRHATILDHELTIAATQILAIDADAIPTGERRAVAGSAFDFTTPRTIGERIDADDDQLRLGGGYNHNFILSGAGMRHAARLSHPASGRTMTVFTDQPGLQLYDGVGLCGSFGSRTGVCLETQHWPDSPNRPDFPRTRLNPGEHYVSRTCLRFGVN